MTADQPSIASSEANIEMNEKILPPPMDPAPLSGRGPPGPPPKSKWIEQRVWDAWEEQYETKCVKVKVVSYWDANVKKEPIYPPLFPVLQKQVDDYFEKEKKMKEEQQEKEQVDREIPRQSVYKNIKKEYETPYKKPIIPVEILEGHEGDDDQFHGYRDWESTFLKPTTERMKNNTEMYPPFNIDADIFNNDESDYDDARSEETDFQDAVDDSDYTRSPLQASRLFGPSPWKILALIV